MILAAHQPNFIPWLPFFDKVNKADVFVLLINVQFEKNGWQNRCKVNEKYWTMPVHKGMTYIKNKEYVNGQPLWMLNQQWINTLCMTLGIDTSKIRFDFPTEETGTERIIELCKQYECDQYLTNPDAMVKYLDERKMNNAGIEVVHHVFPHNIHTFEAFNTWGIDGTQKILEREKVRCGI